MGATVTSYSDVMCDANQSAAAIELGVAHGNQSDAIILHKRIPPFLSFTLPAVSSFGCFYGAHSFVVSINRRDRSKM